MIRTLLIARYRHPTQWRKAEALAAHPDIQIRAVTPIQWKDHFFTSIQSDSSSPRDQRVPVPMVGDATDPHRAMYRTLDFGMRRFRPNIIHAEEEPDSLAALQIVLTRRLFAPKAKLVLHTWQNLDRPKALHVRAILRMTLSAADAVLCANQDATSLLRSWDYRRPAPVIPAIGVDTETFHPCPQANGPTFVVGYVGRFVPEKGIDNLLEAVALLLQKEPSLPIRVILVGGGPAEDALHQQVALLHLEEQTEFAGPMPPEAVARQLCKFSTLVLPSRTTPVWKEQLGRVLLEAMASGIPVIGSDSGAIPEVIDNAGLIFPEGDVASLANRLAQLARDSELWAELRRQGLARAQEYSQIRLAERTLAFYRELLA